MKKLAVELIPPDTFEDVMAYFPVRAAGSSREIAHAYWVLGQPPSSIANQFDCTKQNVVKVLTRFQKALERYEAAQRNIAGIRAEPPPPPAAWPPTQPESSEKQ